MTNVDLPLSARAEMAPKIASITTSHRDSRPAYPRGRRSTWPRFAGTAVRDRDVVVPENVTRMESYISTNSQNVSNCPSIGGSGFKFMSSTLRLASAQKYTTTDTVVRIAKHIIIHKV